MDGAKDIGHGSQRKLLETPSATARRSGAQRPDDIREMLAVGESRKLVCIELGMLGGKFGQGFLNRTLPATRLESKRRCDV